MRDTSIHIGITVYIEAMFLVNSDTYMDAGIPHKKHGFNVNSDTYMDAGIPVYIEAMFLVKIN